MMSEQPVTAQVTLDEVKKAVEAKKEPICGFCKADPLRIHIDDQRNEMSTAEGIKILVTRTIMCQACRSAINVVVMGIEKPRRSPLDLPLNSTTKSPLMM